MNNKHFLIEGEFLKKFGLLSIIEYSGSHNLSPDKIEDKGELIFRKSVTNQTVEYVSDIIVKIKDSFFIIPIELLNVYKPNKYRKKY